MTWVGLAKGLLFSAAMACGATTGHLFYLERYWPGAAMLVLTTLFLFYALSDASYSEDEAGEAYLESLADLRRTMAALSLIVAENALNGAKHIGRTLPYAPAELSKLEEDLMPLLSSLQANRKERERITQEFEKLRMRSRQSGGRRALIGK
jgi:hypothetical protein